MFTQFRVVFTQFRAMLFLFDTDVMSSSSTRSTCREYDSNSRLVVDEDDNYKFRLETGKVPMEDLKKGFSPYWR